MFERILSTDPHFDYLLFGLGFDAYFSGDYDRGVALYQRAREVDLHLPDPGSHPLATLTHIFKHALLGQADAADALISEAWVPEDLERLPIHSHHGPGPGRVRSQCRRDALARALHPARLERVRHEWESFEAAVGTT